MNLLKQVSKLQQPIRKPEEWTVYDPVVVAAHEAGHAIMVWLNKDEVREVSTIPSGQSRGHIRYYDDMRLPLSPSEIAPCEGEEVDPDLVPLAYDYVKVLIGGCAAAQVYRSMLQELSIGDIEESIDVDWSLGGLADCSKAYRYLKAVGVVAEEAHLHIEEAWKEVVRTLWENRDAITLVVDEVVERGAVDGDELSELVKHNGGLFRTRCILDERSGTYHVEKSRFFPWQTRRL